jgi:hypothetical protein
VDIPVSFCSYQSRMFLFYLIVHILSGSSLGSR